MRSVKISRRILLRRTPDQLYDSTVLEFATLLRFLTGKYKTPNCRHVDMHEGYRAAGGCIIYRRDILCIYPKNIAQIIGVTNASKKNRNHQLVTKNSLGLTKNRFFSKKKIFSRKKNLFYSMVRVNSVQWIKNTRLY